MKSSRKVSIKSDKSILLREIYCLKGELVAESHRADENLRLLRVALENLRLLRVALDDHSLNDETAERACTIEGMGCGHIPGDDECNECPNWQLVEAQLVDAHDAADEQHERATEFHRSHG